jgi:hypothetical protein
MCHLYSTTIESPCFTVEKNGTGYEVRNYMADEVGGAVSFVGSLSLRLRLLLTC